MNPIGYIDTTYNPIAMRCTPIGAACDRCWHLSMANRLAGNRRISLDQRAAYAGDGPPVLTERLEDPLHWKQPRRIAVQFMGDLFHEEVPFEYIDEIFDVILRTPQHVYLILSKRPVRMKEFFDGYEKRRDCSSISQAGRIGNRQFGLRMEDKDKTREGREAGRRILLGFNHVAMYPETSGVPEFTGLFADSGDGAWGKDDSDGSQGSLGTLQRKHPEWVDHQSQGWEQGQQQSEQSGIGHSFGATPSCDPCSECKQEQTEGEFAPQDIPKGTRCVGNEAAESHRNDGEGYCGSLPYEKTGRVRNMYRSHMETHITFPLPNVWLGVTAENQDRLEERTGILLQIPAAKYFVSIEPTLSEMVLHQYIPHFEGCRCPECYHRAFKSQPAYTLDWVIIGRETGPGARPAKAEWFLKVIEDCKTAGVPVWVKKAPPGVPDVKELP